MAGILNHNIVDFIDKKTSDDVQKKFVSIFPSNYVTRFITFHSMMTETGAQYPFIIMNTDHSNKKGTHWWSFFDLHAKSEIFLFDSFGFEGFKEFVLQDNRKTLNQILYGIEIFEKKDNKVTIITLTFSMNEYEKIKNANRLSTTTQALLHFMNKFRKKHNLKNEVMVHFVDDQLQKTETDTCGIFQLYFYVNVFNPVEYSQIISDKTLMKKTIEKLLNDILTTEKTENEGRIEAFIDENKIRMRE